MKLTGEPIVAEKSSACTITYQVAGTFETKKEAENYATIRRTKFVRHLVSLRKTAQNVSANAFAFILRSEMKKRWTDAEL